jgi:hypothetical protein
MIVHSKSTFMKFFLLFFMISPAIAAVAQNKLTAANLNGNNAAPGVLPPQKIDKKGEWLKTVASRIPLKSHLPYYDSTVEYGDPLTREDAELNAQYYFERVFGSKAYRLETHKHNYTGYGSYLFCADRKEGFTALYKVYYRVTISVKNGRYNVEMNDFTLENQHNEVSFDYLMNRAKDNDQKAKDILACFHVNNQEQLKKVYNTMAAKDRESTASNW